MRIPDPSSWWTRKWNREPSKRGGFSTASIELKAYLSVLDDLRKKFLYNCIFWDDPLPLTDQEKNVIDFIERKSSSISELGLFAHECGKARVMGEQYGKQRY